MKNNELILKFFGGDKHQRHIVTPNIRHLSRIIHYLERENDWVNSKKIERAVCVECYTKSALVWLVNMGIVLKKKGKIRARTGRNKEIFYDMTTKVYKINPNFLELNRRRK